MRARHFSQQQLKCRDACIAFLSLKRRRVPVMICIDRFIIRMISRIIWQTRNHSGWGLLRHVERTKIFFQVNEEPIRVFSVEHDDFVEFGIHPELGWNYGITQILRFVMQDGINLIAKPILNVYAHEFIDEVFLFTKNSR